MTSFAAFGGAWLDSAWFVTRMSLKFSGLDDPAVLAWATTKGRVVLTHDLSTMIPAMQEQVKRFASCSPIVFVRDSLPVNLVIEEIFLPDECTIEADWAAGVIYLPLDSGRREAWSTGEKRVYRE